MGGGSGTDRNTPQEWTLREAVEFARSCDWPSRKAALSEYNDHKEDWGKKKVPSLNEFLQLDEAVLGKEELEGHPFKFKGHDQEHARPEAGVGI
jgi:hypothetical protein